MGPRLDGGTSFRRDLSPSDLESMPERARVLLAEASRRRTKEEASHERRTGGRIVRLPLPDGREVAALCGASGERGQNVWFFIESIAYIRVHTEHSPADGFAGRLEVEFKAKELHAEDDQAAIVERWLSALHWLFLGEQPRGGFADEPTRRVKRSELHRCGWETHHVELCSDVLGLRWLRTDDANIITPNARMKRGRDAALPKPGSEAQRNAHHSAMKGRASVRGTDDKFAESVSIGNRTSNVSACFYDKLQEQLDKGRACENYRAIWEAQGYRAELHDELGIGRVEFRLHGRGLVWEDKETGEIFDLRDPLVAADERMRRETFGFHAHRFRLFIPGTATERKNCKIDPRWGWVRAIAGTEPRRMKQHRAAQQNTHAAAVERAARGVLRHATRWAALHDTDITSEHGYATVIRLALRGEQRRNEVRMIERCEAHGVELDDKQRRRLRLRAHHDAQHELVELGAKYRDLRMAFMGVEILEARKTYESGVAELAKDDAVSRAAWRDEQVQRRNFDLEAERRAS